MGRLLWVYVWWVMKEKEKETETSEFRKESFP